MSWIASFQTRSRCASYREAQTERTSAHERLGVALVDGFILNALLERTAPKAAQQTRLAENITQPFKTFPV